ncbi:MAG: epoxyqueuosine reductase [Acidimicrobiia bacterium]
MLTIEALEQVAESSGAMLGVTDLAPFDDVKTDIESRKAAGQDGSLGFTYRDPELSTQPKQSFPWAESIIVVAVPYLRPGDGIANSERSVARFADEDRYAGVRSLLGSLASHVVGAGFRAEPVFDDDRLVDRAVAVRAGVAWSGKSTMALTPRFGPWFLIGSVVTDADLTPTREMRRGCGSCTACIPACPTGAIVAPGVLDARLCLAAIFQSRGDIPRDLRSAAAGRVYGCDACLVACPPGLQELSVLPASESVDPRAVLASSDQELEGLSQHWYVPGRAMRFVRRNALVALGNTGTHSDVPLLAGFAGHPDPMIRTHAIWALGAIGGRQADAALALCRSLETDIDVISELDLVQR